MVCWDMEFVTEPPSLLEAAPEVTKPWVNVHLVYGVLGDPGSCSRIQNLGRSPKPPWKGPQEHSPGAVPFSCGRTGGLSWHRFCKPLQVMVEFPIANRDSILHWAWNHRLKERTVMGNWSLYVTLTIHWVILNGPVLLENIVLDGSHSRRSWVDNILSWQYPVVVIDLGPLSSTALSDWKSDESHTFPLHLNHLSTTDPSPYVGFPLNSLGWQPM